jgi:hypothetical protein
MAYSIAQFENNTTNQLAALDNNFITFGALVPIPVTVSGTNALTLTQSAVGMVPTPSISAYTTGMMFQGIATATNTGPVTAGVGAIGNPPVYKDSPAGPVVLTGGEIVASCKIALLYDAALNAGGGGFHLISSTAIVGTASKPASVQINGGATLTMALSGSVSLLFTATPGWLSQDQLFSVTAAGPQLPALGDFLQVCPPSLGANGVGYSGLVTAVGSLSSVASAATVAVRLLNAASASLASNSGIYRWMLTRTVP